MWARGVVKSLAHNCAQRGETCPYNPKRLRPLVVDQWAGCGATFGLAAPTHPMTTVAILRDPFATVISGYAYHSRTLEPWVHITPSEGARALDLGHFDAHNHTECIRECGNVQWPPMWQAHGTENWCGDMSFCAGWTAGFFSAVLEAVPALGANETYQQYLRRVPAREGLAAEARRALFPRGWHFGSSVHNMVQGWTNASASCGPNNRVVAVCMDWLLSGVACSSRLTRSLSRELAHAMTCGDRAALRAAEEDLLEAMGRHAPERARGQRGQSTRRRRRRGSLRRRKLVAEDSEPGRLLARDAVGRLERPPTRAALYLEIEHAHSMRGTFSSPDGLDKPALLALLRELDSQALGGALAAASARLPCDQPCPNEVITRPQRP